MPLDESSAEPGRPRVFLLSPANCNGRRGQGIISSRAAFPLAERLRSREGAALGDVFAYISGLYFRGKLTYARRFAASPDPGNAVIGSAIHIITPNAGLRGPETLITADAIRGFCAQDIATDNPDYRGPLERSARALDRELAGCEIVLLGSIASPKYVDVLLSIFGERLTFPTDFVGRGDMSRGGLLLRRASDGVELAYAPVAGAVRRGSRPPRLAPLCQNVR